MSKYRRHKLHYEQDKDPVTRKKLGWYVSHPPTGWSDSARYASKETAKAAGLVYLIDIGWLSAPAEEETPTPIEETQESCTLKVIRERLWELMELLETPQIA